MAIYKRDIASINLETGTIHRTFLNHSIGYKDQKADHFGIRVFRDGEPVDLTGVSVQGVFMPPQGDPIAITSGNIVSGNEAEVVLPQACYNYDGQFCLAIKLVDSNNSVTGTMRIVDGMVDNTHASGTVAPTSAVPTYQEILSTYDAMVAATAAANGAIAATYSSSSTYKVGDYCIHDGGLYRCTTAITTAEAWTSGHWAAAKLGPDVSDLKSAFDTTLNPVEWNPTVTKGAIILRDTGKASSSSSYKGYARTGLWYAYGYKIAINLSDPIYRFRVFYYDSTGSVTTGSGYLGCEPYDTMKTGTIYIPAKFNGSEVAQFGLSFRRADEATMTDSDVDAIKAALTAYSATDTTLTMRGMAADAKETGDKIESLSTTVKVRRREASVYRTRIARNQYVKEINVTSLVAGGINSTSGANNGSSFDSTRCKTGFIPVSSSALITLGLEDYEWTIFCYSSNNTTTGTHTGLYSEIYTSAQIDVVTEYRENDKYLRICFQRADGAALTTDTSDPTSDYSIILAALKMYAPDEVDEAANIEEYYETEMSNTIASVRACQTEPCLVMPLVTDIHYVSDDTAGDSYLFTKETIYNIRKFVSEVKCDGLICLGDLTDGGYHSAIPSSSANAEVIGSMLMNKMRSVGLPIYFTVGNHDDCRYFDPGWMLTEQIFSTYLSQNDKDVVFDTGYYGMNWYKDFPQFGVRMIQIDTNRVPTQEEKGKYGVANATVTFLNSALSTMSSDSLAVVITHAPVIDSLYVSSASEVWHIEKVVEAIEDSGKTAILFAGHTHYDIATVTPFLNVVTAANKNSLRDEDTNITTKGDIPGRNYVRQLESGTKDLWDVVALRPFSRIVDFIRFGSGVNRCFHITPVSPSTLTTKLTGTITWSSTDTDIATVSSGEVTGVSSGRCGIVATDETGNTETWAVVVA